MTALTQAAVPGSLNRNRHPQSRYVATTSWQSGTALSQALLLQYHPVHDLPEEILSSISLHSFDPSSAALAPLGAVLRPRINPFVQRVRHLPLAPFTSPKVTSYCRSSAEKLLHRWRLLHPAYLQRRLWSFSPAPFRPPYYLTVFHLAPSSAS